MIVPDDGFAKISELQSILSSLPAAESTFKVRDMALFETDAVGGIW